MRWVRRHWRIARWASVLIAAVVSAALVATIIDRGVQDAEMRSCHRLNIKRATDNRDWLIVYQALNQAPGPFRRSARRLEWIPLTNCPRAVYSNARAPQPLTFYQHQPPPAAFTVGPNQ